jgi:hypothetical protein
MLHQARTLARPRSDAPRSEDIVKEREALAELIRTEGWRMFLVRALREWEGAGYVSRMDAALNSSDPTAAKVVHKTALELKRMLQWPEDRLRELGDK